MSTTEHDLPSADTDEALDELFADAEFDEALTDALDEADVELDMSDDNDDDSDEMETSVLDVAADDDEDADDDASGAVLRDAEDVDDLAAEDVDTDDSGDDEVDDGTERHGIKAAIATSDDDDDDFELPEIVPATPEPEVEPVDASDLIEEADDVEARDFAPAGDPDADEELDDDTVSDDILEELRRADIDGPVVDLEPQDDTASQKRKPRRRADYDPAPMPIPAQIPRVLGRKPRVRKVTRVVRHVDPWSVFKIALVANAVLYIIVLTAGVLLWNVAHATGTVDNVERFFESFGWESFDFDGGEIYHAGWIAGVFVAIGFTGLAVLAATLFNLITDLVGGMRFTVLEEEVVETRVSPMRRFVVRRPEPDVPAVLHDESGAMIREAVVDDTGANQRPSR